MGERRNKFKIFVREPEGRRPFRIPKHRCEYNIKVDLKEIEWGRCELCFYLV
jgi:hypothetical protein